MAAKLTISFSDEILAALRANKSITIRLEAPRGGANRGATGARRGGRTGQEEPRAGSLPARVIDWAKSRKSSFGTNHITKRFKLSRAHASMLLSRLANGPYPIQRKRRGVYSYSK